MSRSDADHAGIIAEDPVTGVVVTEEDAMLSEAPKTRDDPDTGLTTLEEDQLLSELKEEMIEKTRKHKGEPVHRGHPVADAASAFGKMASAVALERGLNPQSVMKEMPPALRADEAEITERLHQAKEAAMQTEMDEHGGHMERGNHHVAHKVQSAADHFDRMKDNEAQPQPPSI